MCSCEKSCATSAVASKLWSLLHTLSIAAIAINTAAYKLCVYNHENWAQFHHHSRNWNIHPWLSNTLPAVAAAQCITPCGAFDPPTHYIYGEYTTLDWGQRKFAVNVPGISNCKLLMTEVEGSMICNIHHLTMHIIYTILSGSVSGIAFWILNWRG